jgi:hypothetical protein
LRRPVVKEIPKEPKVVRESKSSSIWILVITFFGVVGAVGALRMILPNPKQVSEDCNADLIRLRSLVKDQTKVLEADKCAEEILGNELYQRYEKQSLAVVEKVHKHLHQVAEEDRRAGIEVAPFLRRYEAAKADPKNCRGRCGGDIRQVAGTLRKVFRYKLRTAVA